MVLKRKKTQAKINWGWDAPENRNGKASRTTKKQQREINKSFKTVGLKIVLICFCLIVLFGAISAGTCYFLTKDDCFKLKGEIDVVINLENATSYTEAGYEVVEFGKDVSDEVVVETNMLVDENGNYTPRYDEIGNPIIGKYYIIYKTTTFKYSKFSTVERIRFVTFEEPTDVVETVD